MYCLDDGTECVVDNDNDNDDDGCNEEEEEEEMDGVTRGKICIAHTLLEERGRLSSWLLDHTCHLC